MLLSVIILVTYLSWKSLGFKTIFNSHFTTESKLLDLKRNDLRIAAGDCSCWGRERELSLSWAEIYQLRFLLFWQFGSIFTLIAQDRKQRNNLAKCSHLTWPPSPAEWSPTSVQLTQFTQNCCNWDFNLLLAYICMYACISLFFFCIFESFWTRNFHPSWLIFGFSAAWEQKLKIEEDVCLVKWRWHRKLSLNWSLIASAISLFIWWNISDLNPKTWKLTCVEYCEQWLVSWNADQFADWHQSQLQTWESFSEKTDISIFCKDPLFQNKLFSNVPTPCFSCTSLDISSRASLLPRSPLNPQSCSQCPPSV